MMACEGHAQMSVLGSTYFSGISGCDFGKGASGGPWLSDYNHQTGIGTLRSVSSWGPAGSSESINGPYFGTSVRALYDLANADG